MQASALSTPTSFRYRGGGGGGGGGGKKLTTIISMCMYYVRFHCYSNNSRFKHSIVDFKNLIDIKYARYVHSSIN